MLEYVSTAVAQLRTREDGQAMVEYALILALVSIAAIAILATIGTDVNTVLRLVGRCLVTLQSCPLRICSVLGTARRAVPVTLVAGVGSPGGPTRAELPLLDTSATK